MGLFENALDEMAMSYKDAVLQILYDYYLENDAIDEGDIATGFGNLDHLLRKLTLRNYDKIWNTSVALCSAHERRGFEAGFRMGVSMMWELTDLEQGRNC